MFDKTIDFSNCKTDEDVQIAINAWIARLYEHIEASQDLTLRQTLIANIISCSVGTAGTGWTLKNAIKHIKAHGTVQSVLETVSSLALSCMITDHLMDFVAGAKKTFVRTWNEVDAYLYLTDQISKHFPEKGVATTFYFSDGELRVSFNKPKPLKED